MWLNLYATAWGFLVSVLNYSAWPSLLPAFQYCHLGQISLSSVLWFHLSFPSANFDLTTSYEVFSRWQIQFSESDEYSGKKTQHDICPNESCMSVLYTKEWSWRLCKLEWMQIFICWNMIHAHLFWYTLLLPREWCKEKCFCKHRPCQTSHCPHSQVLVCWFR